jgi:tRNA A37 threonylcarbamoyladenosine modification protein TsaB
MKILAVEFSVVDAAGSKPTVLGAVCERGGRRAIELVEQVLEKAHCEREAIDCLAIGLGPGSYTGIRGAIALAQGWQLGREVKLLGISSAECIATQAKALNLLGRVNITWQSTKSRRLESSKPSRCIWLRRLR